MKFLLLIGAVLAFGAHHSSPQNLLANPGFEDGDGGVSGKQAGTGKAWENICGGSHPEIYALDSDVKHSGRFSQRMTCQGYNLRTSDNHCFSTEDGKQMMHPVGLVLGNQAIAQAAPAKPGKAYSVGVWVKIEGVTQKWEWFRLGIYWLDANKQFISEVREDAETHKGDIGSHDWKCIEFKATAPANAAYIKVYLHHHFGHGTVWFDDAWAKEM